jgi:hypothetical protein
VGPGEVAGCLPKPAEGRDPWFGIKVGPDFTKLA